MRNLQHKEVSQVAGAQCQSLECQHLRCDIAVLEVKIAIMENRLDYDKAVKHLMNNCRTFSTIGFEDTQDYVRLLEKKESLRLVIEGLRS